MILREQRGRVRILTFNRPDKLNALSTDLLDCLESELDQVVVDEATRVIILTGAGRAFMAGADIEEYAGQSDAEFEAFQRRGRRVLATIERLPLATIAALNGFAVGGGCEFALVCDLIVATQEAYLALPEARLGLVPGGGGTQRLVRAVGPHVAAEMLLAGRRLSAERAHALGLISEVAPAGSVIDCALQRASDVLRSAPGAVAEIKRLLREGSEAPLETALSLEQEALFRMRGTADAEEGVRAFVDKRRPAYDQRGETHA